MLSAMKTVAIWKTKYDFIAVIGFCFIAPYDFAKLPCFICSSF